ncbi:hypothetical protein NW754_013672, partial [Fusarium falciforme]
VPRVTYEFVYQHCLHIVHIIQFLIRFKHQQLFLCFFRFFILLILFHLFDIRNF